MTEVLHFHGSEREFEPYGDDPAKASICRLVGPEISSSMGAGIARLDDCSIAWTVLYDELIVTLQGNFRLRVGDAVHDCQPGDVLWVPQNTPLHYEGNGAVVFYALSPVDWQERAKGTSHG